MSGNTAVALTYVHVDHQKTCLSITIDDCISTAVESREDILILATVRQHNVQILLARRTMGHFTSESGITAKF